MTTSTVVATVLVLVGLAGVVIPVLPGLVLVLGGIAVWSFDRQDATGWTVLAVAALIIAAGTVAKYLWPGRRLRETGVPWSTLAAGAALGLVGFVVLPLVGLPLGFVLGVYLAEWQRLGERDAAWPSTRRALAAVGWSILIELAAGLLATGVWVTGIVLG